MRNLIWVAVVIFVLVIPAFLILRKKKMVEGLAEYLVTGGWKITACPATEPFGYKDMARVECFAGVLGDGRPVTLLLGTRWKSESVNVPKGSGVAQDSFIGFALRADDATVEAWKAKLGYGGDKPVRVTRAGEDAIVVWRGLHRREEVEKRLAAVQAGPAAP
jgi:hypothetical protein